MIVLLFFFTIWCSWFGIGCESEQVVGMPIQTISENKSDWVMGYTITDGCSSFIGESCDASKVSKHLIPKELCVSCNDSDTSNKINIPNADGIYLADFEINLKDYSFDGMVRGKVIGIEYDQVIMESGNPFNVINNTKPLQLGSEITLACYENSKTYYESCLIRSIDKKFWTYDEEMALLTDLQNSKSVNERREP